MFGYGHGKRMIDVLNHGIYEANPNFKYTAAIPTNVFGPNDNYNFEDSHVVPGIMHRIYLAKSN
jgi:GDP-L-fucose synthase